MCGSWLYITYITFFIFKLVGQSSDILKGKVLFHNQVIV